MAKSWTKARPCPICGHAGWGKSRCRGFLHSDGSAVFCENGGEREGYEKTEISIAPFGVALFCYRKIIS